MQPSGKERDRSGEKTLICPRAPFFLSPLSKLRGEDIDYDLQTRISCLSLE